MKLHITIISLFCVVIGLLAYLLIVLTTLNSEENKAHYIIEMYDTEIKIKEPESGKVIYTEQYETNSNLVNALLEDNQ